MAFRVTKTPTFKANVTIETADEKGRTLKETVVAEFERPTEVQLTEWEGAKNVAVCERFLRDVAGMTDDEGQPVRYEGENRDALLSMPPATFALAAAFWQCARLGRIKN